MRTTIACAAMLLASSATLLGCSAHTGGQDGNAPDEATEADLTGTPVQAVDLLGSYLVASGEGAFVLTLRDTWGTHDAAQFELYAWKKAADRDAGLSAEMAVGGTFSVSHNTVALVFDKQAWEGNDATVEAGHDNTAKLGARDGGSTLHTNFSFSATSIAGGTPDRYSLRGANLRRQK